MMSPKPSRYPRIPAQKYFYPSTRKDSLIQSFKPAGQVVFQMPYGITRTLPSEKLISLMTAVTRAMGRTVWPIPAAIYQQFPDLQLFRDAISVSSTDGSRLHEVLLALVKGPTADPEEGGSAA